MKIRNFIIITFLLQTVSAHAQESKESALTEEIPVRNLINDEGETVLMHAVANADRDAVLRILNDPDVRNLYRRDKNGLTALDLAINLKHPEIVELLFEKKENFNHKTQPRLMDPVEGENGNFISYYFGGYVWLYDQITLDAFDLHENGDENMLEDFLSWYFSGYEWLYDQANELIKE